MSFVSNNGKTRNTHRGEGEFHRIKLAAKGTIAARKKKRIQLTQVVKLEGQPECGLW